MVIIEKMAVHRNSLLHQYGLVFRSQSNLEQHTLAKILPLIIECMDNNILDCYL